MCVCVCARKFHFWGGVGRGLDVGCVRGKGGDCGRGSERVMGPGNGSPRPRPAPPARSPSVRPCVRPSFGEDIGARAPPALGVHPPGESAAGSAGCRPRLRGPGRWEKPSSGARGCGCPPAPRPAAPRAAAGRARSSRTAPRSRPRAAARARWVGKGRREAPAPHPDPACPVPSHPGPRTRALCSARHASRAGTGVSGCGTPAAALRARHMGEAQSSPRAAPALPAAR